MDINKLDIGGPEFSQCCFCIDLKLGAYILGCLCLGGTIWGIIDLFIVLGHISWSGLAFVILLLCQLPPAGAFLLMLKTNDEDSRWRFATWFLVFGVIGVIVYFVLMIFSSAFGTGIIITLVDIVVYLYFYWCLRAYAKKGGEFSEALIGTPTIS